MRTLYYTGPRGLEEMSALGIEEQVIKESRKGKVMGRPKKSQNERGDKKMSETNEGQAQPEVMRIQRTVFDLKKFDDVKLIKDVPKPPKPTSLQEALAAVGNDQSKLLTVIYEGLVSEIREKEYANIQGFSFPTDENQPGEEYSGTFADDTKSALINAAVLSIAKMQGYDKSMTPDQKDKLKEKAKEFLRSNPAMLSNLQG